MRLFKLLFLFIAISLTATAQAQKSDDAFTVDPTATLQRNEGWGISLCWWANMCGRWDDRRLDELIDWLVSPEGLNMNIFRYNIGGGDDPLNRHCQPHHMAHGKGLRAEMEGFKDSPDGPYLWQRDSAQRRVMLKIRQRRPDAIFEAFSNSCPYYMTVSGCVGGAARATDDNLRPDCYEQFAHYLVDVCKHYHDAYGITFKTLEPFNEPLSDFWYAGGTQEGCHFSVEAQVAFLKVLRPILKASGLKTIISASDENSTGQSLTALEGYAKAGVMPLVDQWNVHTYSADNATRERISRMVREAKKPLWMSEVGSGGRGIDGNLRLAQKLFDDIRYLQPDAWIDWQYVAEHDDQWCLVEGDFRKETYHKVKHFSVRQQVTRFIKQGYTFVKTTADNTLAAVSPKGDSLVLVTLNLSRQSQRRTAAIRHAAVASGTQGWQTTPTLDVSGYTTFTINNGKRKSSLITYNMPPQSIVTLVIPLRK